MSDTFPITTELSCSIERTIAHQPTRVWRGHEIAELMSEQLGTDIVDTFVALAVLTGEGRIERVAPGRYRAPTASPAELIARLEKELGASAED